MKLLTAFLALIPTAEIAAETNMKIDLDQNVTLLNEEKMINLKKTYAGKVMLIVNVASKCGYTHQYEGLENLYNRYKDAGLVVLGFPSNDFGGQEPGTEKVIQDFCRLTYGIQFPMFEKVRVKEKIAVPLYESLGKNAGEFPIWNFHKYLIDRDGNLAGSYKSGVVPENGVLEEKINSLL